VCVCVHTVTAPWTNSMWAACNVFSVQTSSNNVQEIIEGKVEKRTKGQSMVDLFPYSEKMFET